VVLGRPHLVALGALFVVLAIGIAVLGFAATRRGSFQQQLPLLGTQPQLSTQAAPSTPSSAGSEAGSVADSSATGSDVAATAGAGPAQPTGSAPLAQGAARPPAQRTAAEAIPGDPAARNPGVTPAASDGASAPAPPAKAINAAAAFSFEGIRVLVPDTGDKARERQAVLQLGGGRLTVVDQAGGAIASLPYKAIDGAFYSRSRQPRWRDAAGKEVESKVDLGRLGFFRGDRNWLILLTKPEPLIIRLDDEDLKTVLPAVQEQTGLAIQR
jgi:hypothetical protein